MNQEGGVARISVSLSEGESSRGRLSPMGVTSIKKSARKAQPSEASGGNLSNPINSWRLPAAGERGRLLSWKRATAPA